MPSLQSRKRRAEPADDDDVSGEESPEPQTQRRRTTQHQDDEEEDYGGDHGNGTDSNTDQMVKKLVRLALACEYQRRPIRRTDISEKVLGTAGGRRFKDVFAQTQLQLRSVFGMEMVELPAREKVTLAQKRAAKSQSQSKTPPAAYVLISILPHAFHDPQILGPPSIPTAEEESKYISIYTVLVSLISLSGGQLPVTKMERYLRRLQMEDNTPVTGYAKTELLLKRLEKEGYITKIKELVGAGDEDVFWVIGPRGRVEVGDDGVKGLARTVYGEMGEEGQDDLERRMGRSLGLNDRAPVKSTEQDGGGGQKKRGRKRKEVDEEQEEEDDEDDDKE
ncbi:hypothetical protein LTR78_005499 [Recurvomyces mirabilis]|uniref:MAGE domain-containing protein n=1 Tax=Recurvomyces mirabilis TaxID=574656 RepID=A0AAE0WN30_9PEZI|nr:hypothetical protein LTR78_005499 [Recurvomyces mirabilis]KAK5152592.1 hypothetical protein LTS14_008126 [Recurvomyces mirabilis]